MTPTYYKYLLYLKASVKTTASSKLSLLLRLIVFFKITFMYSLLGERDPLSAHLRQSETVLISVHRSERQSIDKSTKFLSTD